MVIYQFQNIQSVISTASSHVSTWFSEGKKLIYLKGGIQV